MKQRYVILLFSFALTTCDLKELRNEAPLVNEVRQGEKFRINLPEEHHSGYLWQMESSFDNHLLNDLGAVWHGNEKGVDFNFLARTTGQTTLTLHKRKYTDTSETRHYIVKIVNN